MWRGKGGAISTAALLMYTVPVYFLVIPFYLLMHKYGLIDTLWAVIAANVTFAVPYALLILQWYGRLIPIELDDAARIDGATPVQVYTRIYLPLMAPALAVVGIFAFLTAWNEYLYQFILLSSPGNKTVAITLATFFDNERYALELSGGGLADLCAAAHRPVLRGPPLHRGGADLGTLQTTG